MNGLMLTQGLMHASSNELRTIYALLVETKLTSLVVAKTKEWFQKDVDHFSELLAKEVEKLKQYSDDELRLKLFLHFTKMLELPGADYANPDAFEQQAEQIVYRTHELMLKDKVYEQFVIDSPEQSVAYLMVHYQMQQIFSVFDDKLKQLDEENTLPFTKKIIDFLRGLPLEKKQLLMERLQLKTLDEHALYKALHKQGTVLVLSTIVEIAGFRAYTPLISAIATSATLFGISLPLGIYTGAASLLLIITNPFFIVTLAIGGGGLLLYRQNKKLRQSLLPIGILQLLLPAIVEQNTTRPDYSGFIKEWQKKVELQTIYTSKLLTAREDLDYKKASIATINTKLQLNSEKIKAAYTSIYTLRQQLAHLTHTIGEKEKSSLYYDLSTQIADIEHEITQLQQQITDNKGKQGFLKSIGTFFDNNAIKSKIVHLESDKQQLLKDRVDAIIEMAPAALAEQLNKLKQQVNAVEQFEADNTLHEQHKQQFTKEVAGLKTTIYELDTVLEKHQKEFYGVKDMLPKIDVVKKITEENT